MVSLSGRYHFKFLKGFFQKPHWSILEYFVPFAFTVNVKERYEAKYCERLFNIQILLNIDQKYREK